MPLSNAPVQGALDVLRKQPSLGTVTRIICLKLDHVGDLLIAAPALLLLRRSFPQAHITLICGPWNAGLAKRLGIADAIVPLAFFSQNSSSDSDRETIIAHRRQAAQQLLDLALPRADLAIDMRRDEDTRDLLKLIDARYYAGFGDLRTFSYLDVALPFTHHLPAAGAVSLRIRPSDLLNGHPHTLSSNGLHLTSGSGSIDVHVSTDAVWAPIEDGHDDRRLLGAALLQIDVQKDLDPSDPSVVSHSALPVTVARDAMTFGPGWLEWEPWGRWTSATMATMKVELPLRQAAVRLLVSVQGHTSPSHPQAVVAVAAGGGEARHLFRNGDGPVILALDSSAALSAPIARSPAFLMRGGRYRGEVRIAIARVADWEPMIVTVRTDQLNRELARLVLPDEVSTAGTLHFPFEVEIKDASEPIKIEISATSVNHRGTAGIAGIDLDWQQGLFPKMPLVHMEQQLLDLAAMTALRFARGVNTVGSSEIRLLLSSTRRKSSAMPAVKRLRRAKGGMLARAMNRGGQRLVGIGVGANKPTKLWPTSYFIELCRRLLTDPSTSIVFLGGKSEQETARELLAELGNDGRAIDLTASCAIEDLGELLKHLDAFIGLDTGSTHFAGRIEIPTLAIFGAAHDAREWGPVGGQSDWVSADLGCSGCSFSHLSQCHASTICMTGLTPSEVWPAVVQVVYA